MSREQYLRDIACQEVKDIYAKKLAEEADATSKSVSIPTSPDNTYSNADLEKIQNRIKNVVDGLPWVLAETLTEIAEKVDEKDRKSDKNHHHHVVLKTESDRYTGLKESRALLRKWLIDINGNENMVWIPQALHASVHTYKYTEGVNLYLKTSSDSRTGVVSRLAELKLVLRKIGKILVPTWVDPN